MNDPLVQSLLFRSEGEDLDFKAEHYRISGATDDAKSELVKDVLAMVNSWRNGNAYILLGFKEDRPGPAIVTGITESVDDATVQQLVNSKAARPVLFRYEVRGYGGKTVALITVPKQQRPAFLKRNFGKLRANTVYVRRGSSTVEADPAEIAEMATSDAAIQPAAAINVSAITPITHQPFATRHTRTRVEFGGLDNCDLPDFVEPRNAPHPLPGRPGIAANVEYWRELALWVQLQAGTVLARFLVVNNSVFPLSDSKLEARLAPQTKAHMWHGTWMNESPPHKFWPRNVRAGDPDSMTFTSDGATQVCRIALPKILPGERYITPECMAISTDKWAGKFNLTLRLLAHELREPTIAEKAFYVRLHCKQVGSMEELEKIAWDLQLGRRQGHR